MKTQGDGDESAGARSAGGGPAQSSPTGARPISEPDIDSASDASAAAAPPEAQGGDASSPGDDASERSRRSDSDERVVREDRTVGADKQAGSDPASDFDRSPEEGSTSEPETAPAPDMSTDRAEAEEGGASQQLPDDGAAERSERKEPKEEVAPLETKADGADDESDTDPASDDPSSPPDPQSTRDGKQPAHLRSERQGEMPFALVEGEPMTVLPKDLYIPPQALEIFLEAFEGPLDLLLYLIKRKNLDILDVPIAEITLQYMEYIELMKELQLELAAEYLVMAATLAEIKSRMLLPRSESVDEEEDPRAELVRRLQEYERYKEAAARLEQIPRVGRDFAELKVDAPVPEVVSEPPVFRLDDLIAALSEVLARAKMYRHYQVRPEPLSVRERMSIVLDRVQEKNFIEFTALFTPEEGRQGVVVTFLALLELLRESLVELIQAQPFGPIHVKSRRQANDPG